MESQDNLNAFKGILTLKSLVKFETCDAIAIEELVVYFHLVFEFSSCTI
jgi:hypothetical protein